MNQRIPDGDLLHTLTATEENLRKIQRAEPREGSTVHLWRLPGAWRVWSAGPARSSWWVVAADQEATTVVDLVRERSERGQPVVLQVWKDCLAVHTTEIRPAGR